MKNGLCGLDFVANPFSTIFRAVNAHLHAVGGFLVNHISNFYIFAREWAASCNKV
jgi:hypothetical protein